jgi:hypothetical protein
MTTGKLLVGFGGLTGMEPRLYKDNGRWGKDVPEDYRGVQTIEEWNFLRATDVDLDSMQAIGYRHGGGLSTLFLATEEQIEALRALNNERRAQKERAETEDKAKTQAEREAKFAKARETGERVLLRQYFTGCDGSAYECSMDVVSVWAMPDGTTAQTRIHTH